MVNKAFDFVPYYLTDWKTQWMQSQKANQKAKKWNQVNANNMKNRNVSEKMKRMLLKICMQKNFFGN